MYEDIIYRFSKGEDEQYRESLEMYAYPIILNRKSFGNIKDYSLETLLNQKRYGLNIKTEKAFELSKKIFRKKDDQMSFLDQYMGLKR